MKYANRLSSGANNVLIALSETEVAKLFLEDTRSDIGSETEKLKFANGVNGEKLEMETFREYFLNR